MNNAREYTNIKDIRINAFIKKHLNEFIKLNNGEIVTKKEYYSNLNITTKRKSIQKYAKRKINLCYEELKKPIIKYNLEYEKGKDTFLIEVPKIIYYDYFDKILEMNSVGEC